MARYIACIAATLASATVAIAQPPDRDRDGNRDGDRGRDRGRDRGGFERFLARMDDNDDGVITEEEAGERWHYLSYRAEREGLKVGDRLKIRDFIEARERSEERERGGSRQAQPGANGFGGSGQAPRARGFEPTAQQAPSSRPQTGSGNSRSDPPPDEQRDRANRYADGIMRRYDANKNGVLERGEWSGIRSDAAKNDANDDGRITKQEIADGLYASYTGQRSQPGPSGDSRRRTLLHTKTKKESENGRRSYRFTPAHERLPDGLPGWFRDRDANGDGQVAMHEYSGSWTDSRAREFARYDKDGDGLIVPREVAK